MGVPQRTSLPVVAGVLAVASACALLVLNLVGFLEMMVSRLGWMSAFVLASTAIHYVVALGAATVGLVGGIMALLRRNCVLAVVGTSFIVFMAFSGLAGDLSGMLNYWYYGGSDFSLIILVLMIEATIFILSLLSLIFIAKSKTEFLS